MPRPSNSFTTLGGGVPVHYDRLPDYPYGSEGKPHRFYILKEVEDLLDATFKELWETNPYGKARIITSAGAYVNKRGSHGLGRGFDIDAIFWTEKVFITKNYPNDRLFYLGVESIIRRYFGTVLNYDYNYAHQDHFHIDDMTPVGWNQRSKSRVLYLQAVISYVYQNPIGIDGQYGNETATAIAELQNSGDIDGDLNDVSVWKSFLLHTAKKAFEIESASVREGDPLELIQAVFDLIDEELMEHPIRKTLESRLSQFTNHEEVVSFLQQFEKEE